MANKVAFFLLAACLFITSAFANEDLGAKKLELMRLMREKSPDGIIELSVPQYSELVLQNPRPYNLINFFTVRTGCDECQNVYSELIWAAYSHKQHEEHLEVPTFYCVIYYDRKQEVKDLFLLHGMKTIPYVATSEMMLKRDDGNFYKQEDLWKVKKDDAFETQQLLDHFNKRFVTDVPIKYPLYIVASKNLFLFVVLVVLVRIFVSIQDFLINPKLWFSIAWVGYFLCTSGLCYTILNSMPMFKMEQDQYGKAVVTEYFMRSNRGQYGGEGYMVSFLGLLVSTCFLVMIKADKIFKTALARRIGIGCAIFVGFMTVQIYLVCYRIKTPWYSNDFWPPESYQRGPLMRDQGNNI